MRRILAALLSAAVVTLQLSVGVALADAPSNDDIANPQPITYPVFVATPDMTDSGLEPGEPVCTDTEGQWMDQSVWYVMAFDQRTDVSIEINGDPYHSVTAGVFGPFEELPTSVSELGASRNCIYDTGPYAALTERYEPGSYLVQLTTNSESGVSPSIRFDERDVVVAPFLAPLSVSVPEGVGISLEWGAFACSRGLALQAREAIAQTYDLWRGEELQFEWSAPDTAQWWWGPLPTPNANYACLSKAPMGATLRWNAYIDPLRAGVYLLDVHIWYTQTNVDGTVDDSGHLIRYPAGSIVAKGFIGITVTEP
jgi:hypothetical protein